MCVGRFRGSQVEKLLSSLSAECVCTGANSGADFREVLELVAAGLPREEVSWEKAGLHDLRGLSPPCP